MNIRLSKHQKIEILNSVDVYKIMQEVLLRENKIRRGQEHFWVVGLNNANKLMFIELVSLGAHNRVTIAPPEVFRMAIYKLASQLILVHNHPSGTMAISRADKDLTDRMIKSGKMLNIDVIDHLVIAEVTYVSFKDNGIIEELHKSGLYELVERDKANLNEMKIEGAIRKSKVEMAVKMKKSGFTVDQIKEITGLPKREITRLK
ncbi:hypothetical protein WSM22_06740 [Cytophagales bacterium WSM2-2]|nr:hypothetical protein WSM22_06740 [Cytophagales bacterium WSM2-2]